MKPLSRRELTRKFRRLGFDGLISGGRHPYMEKGPLKVHITGEHQGDVTVALQKEISGTPVSAPRSGNRPRIGGGSPK